MSSAVSIIIPTYNGEALLQKHLPHVLAALHRGDELIIVDDASTDGSVVWLKDTFNTTAKHKDVELKVLVNQSNQRFASSCNRGVESAKSEIVVLLNNDVSPEKDFLQFLLPHFEDEKVFAVGCKELAASEHNKEYGRAEASFQRGFYVHRRSSDQSSGETAWVAGGSGAFRKSMWVKL